MMVTALDGKTIERKRVAMAKRLNVLITSGGTKVPIDSVRSIGNMSSGTFGSKIGYEALRAGHKVTFLMAEGSKSPLGLRFDEKDSIEAMLRGVARNVVDRIRFGKRLRTATYSTFVQYEIALEKEVRASNYDAIVLAAAVSDYGVANATVGKIRSTSDMTIQLTPLPKLISKIRLWDPDPALVGFKLLVNSTQLELVAAAADSIIKNGCDLVVANDLRDIKEGAHKVTLVSRTNSDLTLNADPKNPNFLAEAVVAQITRIARWKSKIRNSKYS